MEILNFHYSRKYPSFDYAL